MANSNNLKQKSISPEDFNQVFYGTLQKYNLEENGEQILKKIAKKDLLNDEILLNIARKVISKEIPESELIPLLAMQFKIPNETAEKMSKDIKEKILPFIVKFPIRLTKEAENETEPTVAVPVRPPVGLEKTEKEISEPILEIPPQTKKTPPTPKPKKTQETKKTQEGTDIYREPIE